MQKKRIMAFVVDFLIACSIQAILFSAIIVPELLQGKIIISQILGNTILVTFITMQYLIFRDVLGTRSVGKRILGLRIISTSDNLQAKSLSRLLRNVTFLLGPVEIIFFILFRFRIGDKLASTTVVEEK